MKPLHFALAAASAFGLASPAVVTGATVTFNLLDPLVEVVDEQSTFSLTSGGVTATFTALLNGAAGGHLLNQTQSPLSFGVNDSGSGDVTNHLDGVNGTEAVRVTFTTDGTIAPTLALTQIVLSVFSGSETALLTLPQQTQTLSATTSAPDIYNLTTNNQINSGESLLLAWSSGNGFSFDSLTLSTTPVTPLPTAAWAGIALLAKLGWTRRRLPVA